MNGRLDPSLPRESISPELVLVDPELAARLRPHAIAGPPYAAACAPPRSPLGSVAHAAPALPELPQSNSARRHATRRVRARVGWAVTLLALVGLLGAAFAGPRDAPSIDESAPSTQPTIVLSWQPLDSASYYLVEIFGGGRLVHAESATGNRMPVPTWLAPGRYTWTVRSGAGSPYERRVSEPVEQGWFIASR